MKHNLWVLVKAKKSTRITVSLPSREYTELSALAEQYDVSLSWLTRQAVSEFLERHSKGDLQLPLVLSMQGKAANG